VVLVLAGSWAWTALGRLGTPARKAAQHVVRVQVLNGSGEPGVGVRVAAFLREGGFQVTQVANADRADYFASMVVARRPDLSLAREVAHYLGSPPVIRQSWSADESADVTVVIGSDRSRLEIGP
jgi:hypothetical protein